MRHYVLILLLFTLFFAADAQEYRKVATIGIVADIQYADVAAASGRFYRNSLDKLRVAMDTFSRRKVDFAINLGDAIDREVESLDAVTSILHSFPFKIYSVTGNHDYVGMDNKRVYAALKMKEEYYTVKAGDWRLLFLNTNDLAGYSNLSATKKQEYELLLSQVRSLNRANAQSWNGGIGKKQLEWLSKTLSKAESNGEKVMLFSHHPFLPDNGTTALNDKEVLAVIKTYNCVKAVIAGHHHAGGITYDNKIPFVIVEGMVDTETTNAYAIMELYDNKIVIQGFGRATSYQFTMDN